MVKVQFFENDSSDTIKKSVEEKFPKLKNNNWGFFRCESTKLVPTDIQWNFNELTRYSKFFFLRKLPFC